jgi:ferric-dicitrate binding protein FerR (iron transport regulator)
MMTKEILKRFIQNSCTEAELQEVIRWADMEAFNEEYKTLGFEDWKNYRRDEKDTDDEKFSDLFDKIQQKIDRDMQRSGERKNRTLIPSLITTWVTRAAAILLIPVLAFLLFTLSEKRMISNQYSQLVVDSLEVVAPVGSRTVVHLSDGSEVHLNYGSKLKYPQVFTGKTRGVKLVGEGYFEVAHDPGNPFVVHAGNLQIRALGTSFNVNAYPDEDNLATTLVTGKVVIEKTGTNGTAQSIGAMVPGQHIEYNQRTGVVTSGKGEVRKYIAWTEGKMVFEDATTAFVAERLSRMFNVDIEVKDNVKEYLYTVTFVDEPLFQILDLMTIATPVKYKILPREKLTDGTFTKQKIIIEKRI